MAHSNGIITAPVSFGDVNATLGTSHTDLHSLCQDGNINRFSKNKSVRYNSPAVLAAADFVAAGYGLSAPAAFYANTQNPDATWSYLKPRTNTDWARLSDFNNDELNT